MHFNFFFQKKIGIILNRTIFFYSIFTIIFLQNALSAKKFYSADDGEEKTCEVIGIQNKLSDKRWKDERIGLGIQAILIEALYKSGKFRFLESSEQIHHKRQEISAGMWNGTYKQKDLPEFIEKSESQFLVWAKILYFGRPQTELSIGIMHKNIDETIIRLEITLFQKSTGNRWSAIGQGKSSTTASSVLFSYQDDHVDLDQTGIGNALNEAIHDAVSKLIR